MNFLGVLRSFRLRCADLTASLRKPRAHFSRYRIVTVPAPRAAAQQPPDREPESPPSAPLSHRLVSIRGTGWKEATRTEKNRRKAPLVETKQREHERFHCGRASSARPAGAWWGKSRSISCASLEKSTVAAPSRGFTTMSHPAGMLSRLRRKTSRTRRLIRLRSTAPPSLAGMVIPKRVRVSPLGRKKTAPRDPLRRCPASYTSRNSLRRNNRYSLGKACGLKRTLTEPVDNDPFDAAGTIPCGPQGFSSARETRASWPGA